jgi:uncharacterized protein
VGTYAAWLYSTTRAAFQPLGCESELKASICKILPNHNFRDCTEGLITMILPPLTAVHICAYTEHVDYEWDPDKAIANFNKHGVHFSDAVSVLEDELALTVRDPYSDEEERWITLGMDLLGRLLVVVYTWRSESIRFISARPATPRECQEYEGAGSI